MNSSDALEVFREEMNDEATPYLWSDSLVFRYLDHDGDDGGRTHRANGAPVDIEA